jgi:putative membrane protein
MPTLAAATWTIQPGAILTLGLALVLYVIRWRRVRVAGDRHAPSVGRLLLWLAGIAVLALALMSPIDALADDLLTMHMVQHLLLLDVAPILLILGLTKVLLRPVTRRLQTTERRAGFVATPVFAVLLYIAVMWFWHVPALYDAAARHAGIHVLEHVSFGFAGGLYWWHLLSPIRTRHRLSGLGPVVYMLASKLGIGLLAIGLTFAPDALYPFYERGPETWGLSPTDDQSLAGVIMGLEQSILMGIALAWLFSRLLGESERDLERAERYEAV